MEKTDKQKALQGCLSILAFPIFVLIGGVTVRYMWNTAIVPTLELPALTLPQAIGIDAFVSYIVPTAYIKNTGYTVFDLIGAAIFKTVGFLLIVFVVSFFI